MVLAIASVIGLVATTRSSETLETTALVLAVIAFVADLTIALASYIIATQAEARLSATNTDMQTALGKVDERTEEVRNLVRLQGERLLDMVSQRVIAAAPPQERPAYQRAVEDIREQLREQPLTPPGGGVKGREEQLRAGVEQWVDDKGFQRVQAPRHRGSPRRLGQGVRPRRRARPRARPWRSSSGPCRTGVDGRSTATVRAVTFERCERPAGVVLSPSQSSRSLR